MKCYLLPEVTEFIHIEKELHVKLFLKDSPVPLPPWFQHGWDCRLTHKSLLENFPAYLLLQTEMFDSIFEELSKVLTLSEDSREVSCYIAWYIAKKKKKLKKRYGRYCNRFLIASPITSETLEYPYIEILSRGGGLTVQSLNLANYMSTASGILDFSYRAMSKCGLPSWLAVEIVLKHVFSSFQIFTCEAHASAGQTFANRTTANIYLNNQRKISTDAVVADEVR